MIDANEVKGSFQQTSPAQKWKSAQLQDQLSQTQSASHQEYEVQSNKLLSAGRQKAATQPLGNASHRKSPEVQQQSSQLGMDQHLEATSRAEQKAQKPGKYVCDYCGRACAKPSVLKKHIRSHTGERPYPCVPCGFSFKTKSNLYKHRKNRTIWHKSKGQGSMIPEPPTALYTELHGTLDFSWCHQHANV
uniref:C2H2-type domain-containing protein n=1 Tax=Oryzias melastigma TaxID=30732 RepID=A0A3B3CUE9_ORYME